MKTLLPTLLTFLFASFLDAEPLTNRFPFSITSADAPRFGTSVAIDGRWAIVGAYNQDNGGSNQGSAYLYDAQSGQMLRKLTASAAADEDYFGYSVAISGNRAIVGAPEEDATDLDSGAAYVYDLSTGQLLRKLTASNGENAQYFGWSVAISGNNAIVGSEYAAGEEGYLGAAYVYDVSTGQLLRKLTPEMPKSDSFGKSVAISGNIAIVGGALEDVGGAAYVYDLSTGQLIHKLNASDAADGDFFGTSVAIAGNLAIVGADRADEDPGDDRGAAYVYDLSTGQELAKLTASDGASGDFFGASVAISGNLATVGANFEDAARGAAYVYDLSTGQELDKLTASDAENFDEFGTSVSISDGRVLVGAPGKNSAVGAAYYHDVDGGKYQPDNYIGRTPLSGAGRNLYNATGAGQLWQEISRKTRPVNAFLRVENDGTDLDHFLLKGSAGNAFFRVTYLSRTGTLRSNVTATILMGSHRVASIEPGGNQDYEIRVTPNRSRLIKVRRVKGRVVRTILRRALVLQFTSTSELSNYRTDTAILRVITR